MRELLSQTKVAEQTITINPAFAKSFSDDLAKVNAKLAKVGATISATFGEPTYTNRAEWPFVDTILVQKVTLEVPILRVEGWEFVAKVERFAEGEALTSLAPAYHGEDLGPREWDFCLCEHCSHKRNRKSVYILRNAEGEEKQVGSTCLKDFFGVDPSKTLSAWNVFREFRARVDDEYGFSGGRERGFLLSTFAEFVARSIRQDGWVSKTVAYEKGGTPTSTLALFDMFPAPGAKQPDIEAQDEETAKQAILWARSLDPLSSSDYERNIGAIARAGWVPFDKAGLAASIVGVYLRNKAREAEEAEKARTSTPSSWFGTEGKRERGFTAKLVTVRHFESYYGVRVLNRFVTESGQVLIWWTGQAAGDEGETLLLDGTVKKHETYKGEKQTVLSRCKVH